MALTTYSFLDVQCAAVGPGLAANLGNGAATAEEGISVERNEDKNLMTIGSDGTPMHSLHAGNGGTVTVRLLKTSPMNAMLSAAYNLQKVGSASWGINLITVSNTSSGDQMVCSTCAFKRHPAVVYSKDGPMMEWAFDSGSIDGTLGDGNLL